MIERRRHPDGTNEDIDHGPGPVGRAPRHAPMGGVLIAQAIPSSLKLYMPTPAKVASKRAHAARQRLARAGQAQP